MAGAPFQSWALLELMGHRQVPGMVEEVELAGAKVLRVRVPDLKRDAAGKVTGLDMDRVRLEQFYSPAAVYCVTPTTEATITQLIAREAAYLPLLPPPGTSPDSSAAAAEEREPVDPADIDEGSSTGGPDDGAGDAVQVLGDPSFPDHPDATAEGGVAP